MHRRHKREWFQKNRDRRLVRKEKEHELIKRLETVERADVVLEKQKTALLERQCHAILLATNLLPDIVRNEVKGFLRSFPDLCVQCVGSWSAYTAGSRITWDDLEQQDLKLQCTMCLRRDLQLEYPIPVCKDCLAKSEKATFFNCKHCNFSTFDAKKRSKIAPFCLRYVTSMQEMTDYGLTISHEFQKAYIPNRCVYEEDCQW